MRTFRVRIVAFGDMLDFDMLSGDCLDVMADLPDASVDLIVTDPPYFRVKDEPWDRAWKDTAAFLGWLGDVADGWRRVLKPNGSLYVFASPQLAARVQVEVVAPRFDVLNEIVWVKPNGGTGERCRREALRRFLVNTERIIFAQAYGADGEFSNAEDRLRGLVFEPLRAYLDSERERSGLTVRQVAEHYQRKTGSRTVTGMAGHWFGRVQWELPTADNYEWLRDLLNRKGGDYLRREYDYLRREYDDLRRHFHVTADVHHREVWDFKPPTGHRRHVCEKPVDMLRHIIRTSSRPDATILDTFAGSGATGDAALRERRRFIGIEKDPVWHAKAAARLTAITDTPSLLDELVA
jgi:adenine-specific DNA-methyltransferase